MYEAHTRRLQGADYVKLALLVGDGILDLDSTHSFGHIIDMVCCRAAIVGDAGCLPLHTSAAW